MKNILGFYENLYYRIFMERYSGLQNTLIVKLNAHYSIL